MNIAAGIFLVLHGLVHLLYAGHSLNMFKLQPGMTWPDNSWAFEKLLDNRSERTLAAAANAVAATGFVVGSIAVFASQSWWDQYIAASAIFSTAIYVLFWDGKAQSLPNKGLIAILINVAVLVLALVIDWP